MSRILITADIHCGRAGRLKDCVWSLRAMRQYAHENDIHVVYVLGDLFHDRVNVNIEVAYEVSKFFTETRDRYDQEWMVFPGNHDMFYKNSWSINPLEILKDKMLVLDSVALIETYNQRFWIVPFIYFENVYMKTIHAIEKCAKKGDILLTHIGVNNAIMNVCFAHKNWNIVSFNNTIFDRVFTGHFHCYQTMEKVCYPGSPIPFDFDEGLVDHGFIVYDTDDRTAEFIKINTLANGYKPLDFITITDDNSNYNFENAKVRVHLSREYSDNELDSLRDKMSDCGAISVGWMKEQEKIIDTSSVGVGSVDPISLISTWYDIDKPEGINKEFLLELCKEIKESAQEIDDAQ